MIYGTSITQGGCASRPGMAYTNILSRRIDAPFINLGFSGSGRGEPGEGAAQRERERQLPHEAIAQLAAAGLYTVRIPPQYGGPGGTVSDTPFRIARSGR